MTEAKHIAEQYAEDIRAGKIVACELVRLAVERYFRDLERTDGDYFFNRKYPEHCIAFIQNLRLWEDPWSGVPFILDPWQQFMIWQMLGWRRGGMNGPLRFNMVYLEIPRKNGKTTFGSAMELYHALFGDKGGQVYSAATKRDQAKIPFKDCVNMIKKTPGLQAFFKIRRNDIEVPRNNTTIVPLSADYGTLDGLNASFALIDELHAHKTDDLVNVIKTSTGSRESWQILEITTAGTNTEGVCYDHRKHSINVLRGVVDDERWLGMIYTLDDGDNYRDPATWIKANPSLGRAKRYDYVENEVKEALLRPSYESTVLRYDFNVWTQATRAWITDDTYMDTVADMPDNLRELPAHGGLDLASTRDFTSLTLLFDDQVNDRRYRRTWFWIPADTMDDRIQRQLVSWSAWVKDGHLKLTPGNVQDDRTIAADIISICKQYKVLGISYDRYAAHTGVAQDIMAEGINMRPMPQSITYMSEPTKMLERMILQRTLVNDTNPVFRWQLQNVSLFVDANDNIKVLKHKSNDKIDGVVSAINAVAEWMTHRQEHGTTKSAYNRTDKKIIILK